MLRLLKILGIVLVVLFAIYLAIVLVAALPWWNLMVGWMVIGIFILWIATFFDLWRRADISPIAAVIWTIAVILFPVLGTIVYFFTRPPADRITYRGDTVT
jgi:hypothetical protein